MVDIKDGFTSRIEYETNAKDYRKMFPAEKRCLIKLQIRKDRNLREKLFQVNFANESDSFMMITKSAWRDDSAVTMFTDLYLFSSSSWYP